jgi:hypothetical protein
MGRSLKKRKLKKFKRVKLIRPETASRPDKKKKMKQWEWWLIGAAFVFALVWLIFLGKSGSMTAGVNSITPTPAPAATVTK